MAICLYCGAIMGDGLEQVEHGKLTQIEHDANLQKNKTAQNILGVKL